MNLSLRPKIKRVEGKAKIIKRATASLKVYLRRVLSTMAADMPAAKYKVTAKALQEAIEKEKAQRGRLGRLEMWRSVDYKVSYGLPIEEKDFPSDNDHQPIDDYNI